MAREARALSTINTYEPLGYSRLPAPQRAAPRQAGLSLRDGKTAAIQFRQKTKRPRCPAARLVGNDQPGESVPVLGAA